MKEMEQSSLEGLVCMECEDFDGKGEQSYGHIWTVISVVRGSKGMLNVEECVFTLYPGRAFIRLIFLHSYLFATIGGGSQWCELEFLFAFLLLVAVRFNVRYWSALPTKLHINNTIEFVSHEIATLRVSHAPLLTLSVIPHLTYFRSQVTPPRRVNTAYADRHGIHILHIL